MSLFFTRCIIAVTTGGQYALIAPFFNARFDGKVARIIWQNGLEANVQELDLEVDEVNPNLYHGYRGGWTSLWQAVLR